MRLTHDERSREPPSDRSGAVPTRDGSAIDCREAHAGKVPAVTLGFWIIKIAATTLGETEGDTVTMSLHLGYLLGTAVFAVIFLAAARVQIKTSRFRPVLYWFVIVATTTVGTTMADVFDRSLGIGYLGGSAILAALLAAALLAWHRGCGTIAVGSVRTQKAEAYYWTTILLSQTLGTALGDFLADSGGLGYEGGALAVSAALVVVALLYRFTAVSRVGLFWACFILTRPLGATAGDFLDKPVAQGGLALSRITASTVLAVFIVVCVLIIPQRPEHHHPA